MATETATSATRLNDAPPPGAHDDTRSDPAASGRRDLYKYGTGLALSIVLTLGSFWVASTGSIWGPGIPVLLAVLAIGQMGVHLVFFLHLSSSPDNANNFLALAFGVFIVGLVVFGSLVIMWNLNSNMIMQM